MNKNDIIKYASQNYAINKGYYDLCDPESEEVMKDFTAGVEYAGSIHNSIYLVTTKIDLQPFFTDYFILENHFNTESGMIVYDLYKHLYTTDGNNWSEISVDHL